VGPEAVLDGEEYNLCPQKAWISGRPAIWLIRETPFFVSLRDYFLLKKPFHFVGSVGGKVMPVSFKFPAACFLFACSCRCADCAD
jgi:hypothetical protein